MWYSFHEFLLHLCVWIAWINATTSLNKFINFSTMKHKTGTLVTGNRWVPWTFAAQLRNRSTARPLVSKNKNTNVEIPITPCRLKSFLEINVELSWSACRTLKSWPMQTEIQSCRKKLSDGGWVGTYYGHVCDLMPERSYFDNINQRVCDNSNYESFSTTSIAGA